MLATSGSSMLADMLLVDGDPLQDVTILTDRRRMAMVMKDGDISTIRPALQVVRRDCPGSRVAITRGRRWHGSQELTELPGGEVRLRLRLNSLEEAERWVLSWGTHATVVRPKRLATRIREVAAELAQRYGAAA